MMAHSLKENPFLLRHSAISLYILILFWLAFGVYQESGMEYVDIIVYHGLFITVFYAALFFLSNKLDFSIHSKTISPAISDKYKYKAVKVLSLVCFTFIGFHFVKLGFVPAIKAIGNDSMLEIANIRRDITAESPLLTNYISSIILKGILPFILLYFAVKNNKLFFSITLLIGSFYCFGLMQKSFIIILVIPSLIYVSVKKKWLYVFTNVLVIVSVVISLGLIANQGDSPELKSKKPDGEEKVGVLDLVGGIKDRVLYVPGKVVANWFQLIPDEKPFLHGDGYNFLAKLRGREYTDYSVELYPIMYPEYAEVGYKGTVNTATFVYDYANFGLKGIMIGGVFLSLFMVVLENLFVHDQLLKFSLNLFPMVLLSSTALSTLLFSGGWFFLITLYILFLKKDY